MKPATMMDWQKKLSRRSYRLNIRKYFYVRNSKHTKLAISLKQNNDPISCKEQLKKLNNLLIILMFLFIDLI